MASWFLKCVIVHDLQTRENFYFICQRWLAVEKDDGLIDRLLPVSCDKQKTEFKYLLQKQAKNSLSDGYLWFSVLARPVQSSFTRLDRLTCCVVLLFLSMLMNILYYGIRDSPSPNALKIGPLSLTPEQVCAPSIKSSESPRSYRSFYFLDWNWNNFKPDHFPAKFFVSSALQKIKKTCHQNCKASKSI